MGSRLFPAEQCDITRDGERILCAVDVGASASRPLTLVQNWRAAGR